MKRILISAGHSDADPGACYSGLREADLMLELRDKLAEAVSKGGFKVVEDGSNCENLPLAAAKALVSTTDFAIELHTNASSNSSATGVEVLSKPQHGEAASKIAAAIASALEIPLRGAKGWKDPSESARGRLGFVEAGGLIVEVFFLSNETDLQKYLSNKELVCSNIAEAIGEICA